MSFTAIRLTDKNEMFFEKKSLSVKLSFRIFGMICCDIKDANVPVDEIAQLAFDTIKEYLYATYSEPEDIKENSLHTKEFFEYMKTKLATLGAELSIQSITVMMTPTSSVELLNLNRGHLMGEEFIRESSTPKSETVDYEIVGDEEQEEKKPWWKRIFKG